MERGLLLSTGEGFRLLYEVAGELRAEDIGATDAEPLDAAVARRVRALLPGGQLMVAPSALQVFAVSLPGDQQATSAALAYAVEEHVPWSAEELTALLVHRGEPALAIAVRTNAWRPLLQALRAAGQAVETLVPAALLRLRGLRQHREVTPAETWLVQDADGTHAFELQQHEITGWRFWPAAPGTDEERTTARLIAAELRLQAAPGVLVTAGLPPGLTESLQAAGLQIEPINVAPADDALLWQGALSAGRAGGASVNLAVADLASATPHVVLSTAARQFLVSVALLMAVAAGALWLRAQAWQAVAAATRTQQVELFEATFPEVAVPDAMAARFRSEHRRIVGERGGESIPELPQSVLPALAASLAAHAVPFRSRFEELALNGAALEVECEFRSHEEAIQMCEQLRQQGVTLDSPQLHKLDDTRIGARLRGRMTPATKLAGAQ